MSRRRVWEDARGLGRVRGPSGEEGPALVSLLLGGVQIWPRRVLWSWSSSWYSEVDGGEVTSRLRARGRAVGAAGGTLPAWKAREADAEAGQCVRGARGSGGRRSPSAGGERRVDHPAGAACAVAASTWPGPPLEARGSRPGRRPQAGSPAWLPVLTAPTANGGRRVHRPRLGRSHAPVRAVDTRRASRCTPARPQSYVCLKVGDSEPSRVKCRALSLSDAGAFWGDGGPVAASRSPGTSYESPGPTRC